MKQSIVLTRFYREYLNWVDSGYPFHPKFGGDCGLCNALKFWAPYRHEAYLQEMEDQFVAAGLDETFPFNDGKFKYFIQERNAKLCHKNEQRIRWVREHANYSGPYLKNDV